MSVGVVKKSGLSDNTHTLLNGTRYMAGSPYYKKTHHFLFLLLLYTSNAISLPFVHIEGTLSQVSDQPTWVIVLRNLDDGSIIPWMYNFNPIYTNWTLLPRSHHYQIVASQLQFGKNNVIFHNVCGIEDRVMSGQSMQIRLSGQLTSHTDTMRCHIYHYF